MNTVLKYVIWLDLVNCHAKFAIRSAVLKKMAFEVAIFGNFQDISKLKFFQIKISLPPWHMDGWMHR